MTFKKAQEDNNSDEMEQNSRSFLNEIGDLLLNSYEQAAAALIKLKQEQKAHKQQETQAMTS